MRRIAVQIERLTKKTEVPVKDEKCENERHAIKCGSLVVRVRRNRANAQRYSLTLVRPALQVD